MIGFIYGDCTQRPHKDARGGAYDDSWHSAMTEFLGWTTRSLKNFPSYIPMDDVVYVHMCVAGDVAGDVSCDL